MNYFEFSNLIEPLFLKELNYQLSELQIKQFFDYMNYLISENKKYNLTAIVDPKDIIYKHFLDSCELIIFNNINFENSSFIDIGCGAGFPSIPISILFNYSNFTLVDSVNKKLLFVKNLIKIINLKNVITIHARAEEIGHNIDFIDKYDFCLSRAVSRISIVLEYSAQVLKKEGNVFVYKMADIAEELDNSINAQIKLNLYFKDSINYILPIDSSKRKILRFFKTNSTNHKFPRKAGVPTRNPL